MIINKPGFYISKAGKCEVVAVKGIRAIGWHEGGAAFVWWCQNGELVFPHNSGDRFYITGPYVEPRKPVEAWAVLTRSMEPRLFLNEEDAKLYHSSFTGPIPLIHFREVED